MSEIRYHVAVERPHEHLFSVEARFPAGHRRLELWMPAWTPGSYFIREYARNVQELRAFDSSGAALPVERSSKDAWILENRAGGEILVRYRVYANELTVRTSFLDGSHGYFNGASMFVTSDAHRSMPCELTVSLPEGWRAFCALPSREGALRAESYDELVDSPVELGPHQPLSFVAAGKPHEIVLVGEAPIDRKKLVADLARICETEAAMFGGLPFERYLFIVHLTEKSRGGLEHRASCSLQYPRFGLRQGKGWEEFLALASHEYFHLWNVKRILPRALVPFRYRSETYTRLLWAMEGITSYYDMLLLRRAGLVDGRLFLEKLGETITAVESAPGRHVLSLEESSLLAWVKLYRPDENTPNSAISYYTKGEAVAALLDLRIRTATSSRKSLDDVMRLLFARYGGGDGVPEDGVEAACREIAGDGLADFFERSLRSVEELDYATFDTAGLSLRRRVRKGPADKGGTPGDEAKSVWLGVELKPGDRAVVATSYSGSAAAREGLYAGDEIVALDGFRVSASSLQERLATREPGDRARLALFREDRLLELELTLEARPADACYLERRPDATAGQKALFEAWLGEPFAPSGA
jgi:predicted metalloprotease with PDZ domain